MHKAIRGIKGGAVIGAASLYEILKVIKR